MKYSMSLRDEYFNEILNNQKNYEIRLNDYKRKKIRPSDTIIFKNLKNGLLLEAKVIEKVNFKNFTELYLSLYKKSPWLSNKKLEDFKKLIYKNYTEEKEKLYGVTAIKIDLVKSCSLKNSDNYEI